MSVSPRLIRARIRSIGNTRKITKAMELVAASKMRRATGAATAARPYAEAGWDMLVHLIPTVDPQAHPLLAKRPVRKVLMILVTSHRGLAGGLNANILRKVNEQLRQPEVIAELRLPGVAAPSGEIAIDLATVGRKGEEAMRRAGKNIIASFTFKGDVPTTEDIRPISSFVINQYAEAIYDKVVVAYTDFVSIVLQRPKLRQILPISSWDLEKMISEAQHGRFFEAKEISAPPEPESKGTEYLFEPTAAEILDFMLPRLVEVQIYQALLESSASEHSARMMAMRNATEAAGEMIDDLTFTFNQARQAGITREISEIAAGKAALE